MKYQNLYTILMYFLTFLPTLALCCDLTLDTPTERGRCEELIREHDKLQKDLIEKYDLAQKTTPKEELPEKQREVVQEIDHLRREYKKRIQDVE